MDELYVQWQEAKDRGDTDQDFAYWLDYKLDIWERYAEDDDDG